ncbi:DNA primase family protein [Hutsoniella sourekii]|uniref:DNA primase family protein n=1 Tax=Hutsoniella sourekii TaxID=87650 RepID=UPI0004AF86E7|nr:phage/plasmid primase, P4 family [Hutsoniella sourekii]
MYQLHVHPIPYTHKPSPQQASSISKTIVNHIEVVTAEELASSLENGHSVVLGLMDGERKKNRLISQQIMMLDFDNTLNGEKAQGSYYVTIDDVIEDEWMKENASFIYKTFGYSEDWQKFRVVIFLDKILRDPDEVSRTYEYLMEHFPQVDKAPKDCSRIFYGGTEVIPIQFGNTWSPQQLVEKRRKPAYQKTVQPLTKRQASQMMRGYINREEQNLKEYGNALSAITVLGKAVLTGEIKEEWAREYVDLLAMNRPEWQAENQVKLNEFLGKRVEDIYTNYTFREKFSSPKTQQEEFDPFEFADEMIRKYDILRYKEKIYYKDDVVWKSDKNGLLRLMSHERDLKRTQDQEVIHQLDKKAPEIEAEITAIQLKNDFRIEDGELLQGATEAFTPFLLDVKYDPTAYNPDVDDFLNFLVMDRPELRVTVEELLGHILLIQGFPHKVFFLIGEKGANGKSTFLEMLNNWVGDLGSNVNLEAFNDDTSVLSLEDKIVNIGDDIDASYLDKSMNFKTLASGNTIQVRPIYQEPRRLQNTATLIFTANDMPTFRDKSGGIERRLVVIPCDNVVKKADFSIDKKLSTDSAKSYLLNLALEGVGRIRENGGKLSDNTIVDQMVSDYIAESDSIVGFIRDEGIDQSLDKKLVYQQYKEYCEELSVKPQKMAALTRKLKSLGYEIKDTTRLGKRMQLYVKGI